MPDQGIPTGPLKRIGGPHRVQRRVPAGRLTPVPILTDPP